LLYIQDPKQAIAVRAFAMTVAFNISKSHPELINELLLILQHILVNEQSAGVKSRAKQIIKVITKN